MAAITVDALHKRYDGVPAVDGISFEVATGEVFALLGANGAGKTTTIEILEGHRRRTSGAVRVLGHDPEHDERALRERTGIVLQECGIDLELTVGETLRIYAGLYRRPLPVARVLELCGLTGSSGRRVRTLSGGMRRRLDLGLALVGDPELLFLDEPTTGFDPTARRSAWEMIDGLRRLGKTVLLTSHYMDEVERLADRIAVLRDGRIVATGTPATLGGRDLAVAVISFDLAAVLGQLPAGPWERPQEVAGRVVLRTLQPTRALSVLTTWALAEQIELVGLTVSRPTLEETYLELSGTAAP